MLRFSALKNLRNFLADIHNHSNIPAIEELSDSWATLSTNCFFFLGGVTAMNQIDSLGDLAFLGILLEWH